MKAAPSSQSANFKTAVMGYVKQALALVGSKGTPEEAAAYLENDGGCGR